MFTIENLHAVVTGGATGIGRATAITLKNRGCQVVSTCISDKEAQAVASDPEMSGIKTTVLDVRDNDAVQQFFGSLDRLDILVNCAGVGSSDNDFIDKNFMNTVDVNLHGTMRCCVEAKPLLAKNGGSIVNIASMMSFFANGVGPGYCASKGAVAQLTKSFACAWGTEGIRVNAVAPGWIETPMTKVIRGEGSEIFAKVKDRTPMDRWGKPEEIASAIAFLVSPAASFVHGVILPVDGGYMVSGM